MQKEPTRTRPRSFVGGGSFEFTYDKFSGGIRDSSDPNDNIEKKPRRPLSLYESLTKEFSTSRQNSTSSTRPDDDHGRHFAQLNKDDKAVDINKEKMRRSFSSEKGEDGLGLRKDSAGSKSETRALYVELSSPPPKTGSVDEKFNAVSRLRSLFDQGKSAPVAAVRPASFTRGKSAPQPESTIEKHVKEKEHSEEADKENNLGLQARRPKFEKIETEKKKKLFGPPAAVKLDDLLKRESPRSPEEKPMPKFRRSFPAASEPRQKELHAKEPASTSRRLYPKDEFEEIHKRRKSLPKKRSSSFEFEGLEDNVEVFGEKSIDINSILGVEPPKEDPIAEAKEEAMVQDDDGDRESKSESCKGEPEDYESNGIEREEKPTEKTKEDVNTDVEVDETYLKVEVQKLVDPIISTDVLEEAMVEEIASTEECAIPAVGMSTEQSFSVRGEDTGPVDEDFIMPHVEDTAEAGMDLDALENLEVISEHNDSVVLECDSFDSFALNVKSKHEELGEVAGDVGIQISSSGTMDESKTVHDEEEITESEVHSEVRIDVSKLDSECPEVVDQKEAVTVDLDVDRTELSFEEIIDDTKPSSSFQESYNEENIVKEGEQHAEDKVDITVPSSEIERDMVTPAGTVDERTPCSVEEECHSISQKETPEQYTEFSSILERKNVAANDSYVDVNESLDEGRMPCEEEIKEGSQDEGRISDDDETKEECIDVEVVEQEVNEEEALVEEISAEDVETEPVPVAQLSIIAAVSGLTKEDESEGQMDDTVDEPDDESLHKTVELEDDYYDSDTVLDDDTAVSSESQMLYSSVNEGAEDAEESVEEVDDEEHVEEPSEDLNEDDMDTTIEDSHDNIQLPPPPSHSCLASRSNGEKKERKVSFHKEKGDVIFTYSADEYNRSNYEIDALTASAEWELEKRVEDKDMFTVDLDKRDGGLGLSIIGLGVGTDSGVEKLGIFVKSLTPNGAAYKDRRIQTHDQILEVNGTSLVGVTQDFAANTLRNTSGKVRFLMGRDKAKRHYQAPTSEGDPILQDLERKHNLELEDIKMKILKAESRASIAEHNLEEVRQSLLEEEERRHLLEEELDKAKTEIEYMKESPFYRKSLKNEIKKPKYEKRSTEKIESLERSVSQLTNQLSFSEENLDQIQHEFDDKVVDLKAELEEKETEINNLKNENNDLLVTRKHNAEKLAELEESLAAANQDQERRIQELQDLKDKCVELETEVIDLKDVKFQLADVEKKMEAEKILHEKDEKVTAAGHEESKISTTEVEKLQMDIQHLSEEIALRNQFADIIVAERDTLKELVADLESANEKQNEVQEKKDIENAMKMMAYENKITNLENTIKELQQGSQEKRSKPKPKLFPEIEHDVKVEKEVEIQREIVVQSEKEAVVEAKPLFVLPPRDYDDQPNLKKTEKTPAEIEKVTSEVEVPVERIRKESSSSSSSSSESDDEEEGKSNKAEEKKEVEKIIEEIVVNEVKIEEQETSIAEDIGDEKSTPVSVVVEDIKPNKNIDISGNDSGYVTNVVNPVQKPPRTYSDVSHVGQDKHLRSYSLSTKLPSDGDSEKVDEFVNVSQNIKVKKSSKFHVIVKSDVIEEYEQKPFDEEILKDLPESSVDSDSEVLAESKPAENTYTVEVSASDKSTFVVEAATVPDVSSEIASSEIAHSVDRHSEKAMSGDAISENAPKEHLPIDFASGKFEPVGDNISVGTPNGDAVSRVTDNGEAPSTEPEIQTTDDSKSPNAQDRSSFLEAFSQNPKFGSWFNGELTIIEQERKDEQADEIVSQVVEGKERALSSSSSSSGSSREETKDELNTSLKLDESYLQQSQFQVEIDQTDSPLNRLESVAVESPLQEQAKIDEIEIVRDTRRPLSTNFDDLPRTDILPSAAQRDKLKVASAIPRKSPQSKLKRTVSQPDNQLEKPTSAESISKTDKATSLQNVASASASTENLAIDIDYGKKADKEKRKSYFNFFSKGMFGKKKKHKKSTENLLAADESQAAQAKSPVEEGHKENLEEEEGVVPLDMQRNLDVDVRMSTDSGVDTHHTVNGVSSEASDSTPSSTLASPVTPRDLVASNENIAGDSEDGPVKDNRLSWIQRPVIEWDVRQVGLWLIRMDLEQYSNAFQERNIDGLELLNLNGSRLKELGVLHGDDRALIKRKIKEFKSNSDEKQRDLKKEGKTKDKFSKKIFWKGKYTVNE